jgi:hypothetical protein
MGGRLWQEYHQEQVRGLHFTIALPLQEAPVTFDSLKHFDSSSVLGAVTFSSYPTLSQSRSSA